MDVAESPPTGRTRAARLSPDDRRAAVLEAVIPLVQAHGRDVSTRQIAEASGVAEGTVFRAFGTKEALIEAAIESYFAPERFREAIAAVSPALPVEEKIRAVLLALQERFRGVAGVLAAIGDPPLAVHRHGRQWTDLLVELLTPDMAQLAVPAETIGRVLSLLALATTLPHVEAAHALTVEDLVQVVAHGVLTGPGGSGAPAC